MMRVAAHVNPCLDNLFGPSSCGSLYALHPEYPSKQPNTHGSTNQGRTELSSAASRPTIAEVNRIEPVSTQKSNPTNQLGSQQHPSSMPLPAVTCWTSTTAARLDRLDLVRLLRCGYSAHPREDHSCNTIQRPTCACTIRCACEPDDMPLFEFKTKGSFTVVVG